MSSKGPSTPKTSRRIQETSSAIIDDLLQKYSGVEYNLAPGATFFGMRSEVGAKLCNLLTDQKRCAYLSRYGDVVGSAQLCKRWANVLRSEHTDGSGDAFQRIGLDEKEVSHIFPDHELMITAGANQGFMNVILAVCDPGNEVLLILPYYFSHLNALSIAGVKPVCVPVSNQTFLPKVEDIQERITRKSKALVIVNPGNPSGIEFPQRLIEQITKLCEEKGLWLIIDEAYREFCYDHINRAVFTPKPENFIIKLYTMSKAYGLAGWRVGGLLYPKTISEDMRKIQDTIPTHASMISQAVAFEALRYPPLSSQGPEYIRDLLHIRERLNEELKSVYDNANLPHVFVSPNSAFYFFLPYVPPESPVLPEDDMNAVVFLAEEHSVLVCPGFAFGMPGYLRMSYGTIRRQDMESTAIAIGRGIADLLKTRSCES